MVKARGAPSEKVVTVRAQGALFLAFLSDCFYHICWALVF